MSETSGIGIDGRRLALLASSFEASPREMLALAARFATAKGETTIDRARIDAELARVRTAGAAASAATEILLLGYASYASDDLDRALEMVWAANDLGDA
jgi:sigma54-dependent transcription regulator